MTSPWELSEILDEEQEGDTDLVEFDVPASRSYDWKKRAIIMCANAAATMEITSDTRWQ